MHSVPNLESEHVGRYSQFYILLALWFLIKHTSLGLNFLLSETVGSLGR